MKRLFYLTGTIMFLAMTLAIGVHIGQQSAEAQSSYDTVATSFRINESSNVAYVVTQGGSIWRTSGGDGEFAGNVFGNTSSVRVEPTTWGQLKNKYVEDK